MNLTIELPDELGEALKSHAEAKGLSPDGYVREVLQHELNSEAGARIHDRPLETGYGTWAKYGPAPSAEEINANRREMFRNFGEDS